VNLESLGWNDFYKEDFKQYEQDGLLPARIYLEHKNLYKVFSERGSLSAEITGKMRFGAGSPVDFPSVGDWVALRLIDNDSRGLITAVLRRKGSFVRKVPGPVTEEHVLAANVDTAFLVAGLDNNFNPRRIERYLTLTWESGADPIIVLNKADLVESPERFIEELKSSTFGVPIIVISAKKQIGLAELAERIKPESTVVFLGSSGVGKSSIINALMGEKIMSVNEVRESDSRGRHTTTHRQLFILPQGGCVIDTPGLRGIKLWGDESDVSRTFEDVEQIAENCRFRDCSHTGEPGCAVEQALKDGTLEQKRLNNYFKMQKEMEFLRKRKNVHEKRKEERKWQKYVHNVFAEKKRLRKKGLL